MQRMNKCRILTLAIATALTGQVGAQAIQGFTGGTNPFDSFYGNSAGDSIGYRFTVLQSITVTSVGILNSEVTDGSVHSRHNWAIWDDNQTLLASAFIDPQHGYQLGDFFYSDFAFSLNLEPGTTYTIAIEYAHNDGDSFISSPSTLDSDPAINIINGVFPADPNLGLEFPEYDSGNIARLGPNFLFNESPTCLADVNNDGMLSPTDFTAWVGAFNSNAPGCDQNNDGMCTPTDFSAWIGNYNAGC